MEITTMPRRRSDDHLDVCTAGEVRAESIRWLVPNIFALGQLTILDGDPGLGKSLLMLDLAAKLSTGRSWPDGSNSTEPASTIYLTAEDSDDVLGRRLRALNADLTRIFFYRSKDRLLEQPLSFPANAGFLDRALTKTCARLVVIDPVIAFLDPAILSGSDEGIRRFLYPLAQLAQAHQCAVILIRHLNKRAGGRSLYRGGGSIGFVAHCRSAWLVGREPAHGAVPLVPKAPAADPEPATLPPSPGVFEPAPVAAACVLAQQKNNNGPLQPSLRYQIISDESGYPTLVWLGACPLTADELVALPPRTATKARGRAIRFLKRFLAAGPVTTDRIWKAGLEQDLYERTLRRAKEDLGIKDQVAWIDGIRRCFWMLEHHKLDDPSEPEELKEFQQSLDELWRKYPAFNPLDDQDAILRGDRGEPRGPQREDEKPQEAAPVTHAEAAEENSAPQAPEPVLAPAVETPPVPSPTPEPLPQAWGIAIWRPT
jgi:hypothetical protein